MYYEEIQCSECGQTMLCTYNTHTTDLCAASTPACGTHLQSLPLPHHLCPACTSVNTTLRAALKADRNAPVTQNPLQFQQQREPRSPPQVPSTFPYQQWRPPYPLLSTQLYSEEPEVPAAVVPSPASKGKGRRRSPKRVMLDLTVETIPEEGAVGTVGLDDVGKVATVAPAPATAPTPPAKRKWKRKSRAKPKASTMFESTPEEMGVTTEDGSPETMMSGGTPDEEGGSGNGAGGLVWLPVRTADGMAETEAESPRKRARKNVDAGGTGGGGAGGNADGMRPDHPLRGVAGPSSIGRDSGF